jgi:hypothetical protein
MGKMKELAMDLAVEYHTNKRALRQRLLEADSNQDKAWYLSQMGATKNFWEADGTALAESKAESKLSDKVFIGGEGIPKTLYRICRQCLWDFGSFLDISYANDGGGYGLMSNLLPELTFTIQDNAESCPMDEPEQCSCGNWMWDRVGHDSLLKVVARGWMTVDVATAWINSNLSYNLDTRSYAEDYINTAIINWESRWLD